jgi:hypothetical protein
MSVNLNEAPWQGFLLFGFFLLLGAVDPGAGWYVAARRPLAPAVPGSAACRSSSRRRRTRSLARRRRSLSPAGRLRVIPRTIAQALSMPGIGGGTFSQVRSAFAQLRSGGASGARTRNPRIKRGPLNRPERAACADVPRICPESTRCTPSSMALVPRHVPRNPRQLSRDRSLNVTGERPRCRHRADHDNCDPCAYVCAPQPVHGPALTI